MSAALHPTRLALALLLALPACLQASEPPPAQERASASEPASPRASGLLTRVEPNLVCMINDQYMAKPQIPVEVAGATYYGCCAMCESKLANDPASRSATDPVSKRAVDKAAAVIGMEADGKVHYFESEANLAAWTPAGPSSR